MNKPTDKSQELQYFDLQAFLEDVFDPRLSLYDDSSAGNKIEQKNRNAYDSHILNKKNKNNKVKKSSQGSKISIAPGAYEGFTSSKEDHNTIRSHVAWTSDEEAQLIMDFKMALTNIAIKHQRTYGAILARLVKMEYVNSKLVESYLNNPNRVIVDDKFSKYPFNLIKDIMLNSNDGSYVNIPDFPDDVEQRIHNVRNKYKSKKFDSIFERRYVFSKSIKDISIETGYSLQEIKECLAKWLERFTANIDYILGQAEED